MDKKGQIDAMLNIIRLMVLVAMFLSIVLVARGFIVEKIDIFEIESKLLAQRIFISNELNYFDKETNRLYVGIVDLQKFNSPEFEKNLVDSIYYGKINSEASAKLTLADLDDGQSYDGYYNKDFYNEKKVLVEAKLAGAGSARRLDTDFYVLIKDGDKMKRGVLKIDAILPNS